jgi:Family of unknown function (DUF5335)
MITEEIPREQWIEFFDSFSLRHDRWLVTVELLRPDIGAQVQSRGLPLVGITADLKASSSGTINIMLGTEPGRNVTHSINDTTAVVLEQTEEGGVVALKILSQDQTSTILRFRSVIPPERLDGVLQ